MGWGADGGRNHGFRLLGSGRAGVNPESMHSERVDGYNPLAVVDAIKRRRRF